MSPDTPDHGTGIGATLKDARRRVGMDVKEAEERTKIRARYLRALEAEDWEVLPAPAYVRGFLRTYGALLGLDGERLADEYRRTYEEPSAAASPASEPVLQRRRRPEGSGPSRGTLIAAVAAVIVALLITLAVLSGDEGDEAPEQPGDRNGAAKADGKGGKKDEKPEQEPRVPIDFELEALGSVQVCVAARGEALVDSQVLAEGTTEQFSGERRYRVDLPGGGAVRVSGGGAEARLSADGEASWEVNSNGIAEIEYAGPECP